jgi:hypothetical protein
MVRLQFNGSGIGGGGGSDPAIPPRIKGGNISAWQPWLGNGVDVIRTTQDTIDMILLDVEELNLTHVTLPIKIDAATLTDSAPTVNAASLAYAHLVRDQLPVGVQVIIEPYPWVAGGTLSETEWNPSNVLTWFTNWEAACETLATEFPGEYGMYVSSNLPYVQGYSTEWIDLIDNIKLVFSGNIIFRTNWWSTGVFDPGSFAVWEGIRDNPIWAAVDIIAISAYFELNESDDPSEEEMLSDLYSTSMYERSQNIVEQCRAIADEWGKPFMFGELNVSKWSNGASAPWDDAPGATLSRMVQRNYFGAYMRAFSRVPNWLGFSIFNIGHPYADGGYILQRPARRFISAIPPYGSSATPWWWHD